MKGGRPAVYLGARVQDKRIRYMNLKGRTRAFYARWRPQLKRWECHLTGYGLKHRQWFSESQTLALHKLRLTPCLWDWREIKLDKSVEWDGIPDKGYGERQQELFTRASDSPLAPSESAKTLPATSYDRTHSELVDHGGIVVGSLPADQLEIYFPAHAFKGPRVQAVAV